MSSSLHSQIQRIRDGDDSAFESLFRAYGAPCLRFAETVTGDRQFAEDIVQDVFGWLWTHRTTWSPPPDLLAYLLTATRNRALNRLRSERRRSHATDRYTQAREHMSPSAPDTIMDANERGEYVSRVLAELPEDQRTLLVLRWRHGFSWEQAAGVLGISVDAAKKQHSRLLATLRNKVPNLFE